MPLALITFGLHGRTTLVACDATPEGNTRFSRSQGRLSKCLRQPDDPLRKHETDLSPEQERGSHERDQDGKKWKQDFLFADFFIAYPQTSS